MNQLVVKGKFDSPLITIDPDAFNQYQITQVPTIISREQSRFAKKWSALSTLISSSANWPEKPDQDLFPDCWYDLSG
uniref:TrbC family F-type conjugative pilus assembly protein n=1 Tax=Escherichia coli TaxID=562 RepID=UPI003AF11BA2